MHAFRLPFAPSLNPPRPGSPSRSAVSTRAPCGRGGPEGEGANPTNRLVEVGAAAEWLQFHAGYIARQHHELRRRNRARRPGLRPAGSAGFLCRRPCARPGQATRGRFRSVRQRARCCNAIRSRRLRNGRRSRDRAAERDAAPAGDAEIDFHPELPPSRCFRLPAAPRRGCRLLPIGRRIACARSGKLPLLGSMQGHIQAIGITRFSQSAAAASGIARGDFRLGQEILTECRPDRRILADSAKASCTRSQMRIAVGRQFESLAHANIRARRPVGAQPRQVMPAGGDIGGVEVDIAAEAEEAGIVQPQRCHRRCRPCTAAMPAAGHQSR